jgi:hypothetical protein
MNEAFKPQAPAVKAFEPGADATELPSAPPNYLEVCTYSNSLWADQPTSRPLRARQEWADPNFPSGEFSRFRGNWYPAIPLTHITIDLAGAASLPSVLYTQGSVAQIRRGVLGESHRDTWSPAHVVNCTAQVVSIRHDALDLASLPSPDFILQTIASGEIPQVFVKKLRSAFFNQLEEFVTLTPDPILAPSDQQVSSEAVAKDNVVHLEAVARAREHSRPESQHKGLRINSSSGLVDACETGPGNSPWHWRWRSLLSALLGGVGFFTAATPNHVS